MKNIFIKENVKQRTYYYDILRIIACLLVIVNHSETKVFLNIGISATWFVSLFKFLFCKIAVPIFFMIGGALLLIKDESYKKVLWRIARMIIVILVSCVILNILYSGNLPNLKGIVTSSLRLIKKPYYTAYWYIYALIGLYIMTPIIRKMVKNMEEKDFRYYFIIWALYTGLLPLISKYIDIEITGYFNLAIFNVYVGYYILGYWLSTKEYKKINDIKTSKYILLILMPIVLNLFLTYIQDAENGTAALFLDGYQFITIMISSSSMFCLIRKKFENVTIDNKIISKSITEIGKCTFGIYLIHVFLLDKTNDLIYYNLSNLGINYEISILLQQGFVFIASLVLTYIIRKVPFVNRII